MNKEFYPSMINRSIVMVIPKNPYYKWEQLVFPDTPTTEENQDEYTSYLLEDSIFLSEPKEALKDSWKWIFENELLGICTDDSAWPKKRTWKMFAEWFDVKFSSLVLDMVNAPVEKED